MVLAWQAPQAVAILTTRAVLPIPPLPGRAGSSVTRTFPYRGIGPRTWGGGSQFVTWARPLLSPQEATPACS